jgi:hypothetical protein
MKLFIPQFLPASSHFDPSIFLRILLPYCLAQILSLIRYPNTDSHEINKGIDNSVYSTLADGANYQQERHCSYKLYTEARSRNQYCSGKAGTMKYSEWVSVALLIQYSMRMCHIILPFVALLAITHCATLCHIVPHYLIKDTIFGKTLLDTNLRDLPFKRADKK